MAFQYENEPDSNVIFVNSDLLGKISNQSKTGDWSNFGGDKLWPSPQSAWQDYLGRTWPPDPAFDGTPEHIDILPNGVRMSTPISSAFGMLSVRTITMNPGQARLYIAQKLAKTGTGAISSKVFALHPLGIWSITQLRGDATVIVPYDKSKALPRGYVTFEDNRTPTLNPKSLPVGWSQLGKALIGRRDPASSHKVGCHSSEGWTATVYNRMLSFTQHYTDQPGAPYPDSGCQAEVYDNGGATAYMEMEIMGPLHIFRANDTSSYNIYWQLDHLPRLPRNDQDMLGLVRGVVHVSSSEPSLSRRVY